MPRLNLPFFSRSSVSLVRAAVNQNAVCFRQGQSFIGNRYTSKQAIIEPPKVTSWQLLQVFSPFLVLVGAIALLDHYSNPPREVEILHAPIEIKSQGSKKYIVNGGDYSYVAPKPKGDLSGAIVQDKEGRRYLKKGAPHLNGLLQEFFISNLLHMARPEAQPEALILQEILPDGKARFFTLSRIYENSMDLEEFIRLGGWKEKLAQKPLIGMEVALAADNIMAKQKDTKLANILITETENGFQVGTIDHECAGASMWSFINRVRFTLNLDELSACVRDLYPPSEHNKSGLAGDPRAKEFMLEAKKFMKEDNVLAFYTRLTEVPIVECMALLAAVYQGDGLLPAIEMHQYFSQLEEFQALTREFLLNHELEMAVQAEEASGSKESEGFLLPPIPSI